MKLASDFDCDYLRILVPFGITAPGGGYFHQNRIHVDVPAEPRKFDSAKPRKFGYLYTNFLPITHLFDRKAPNFAQIGCFLQ